MRIFSKKQLLKFNELNLERRILITSLISGTLICFMSTIGNYLLNLGVITTLTPFIMWMCYVYFLYIVLVKSRYKLATYASFLMLSLFVFPILWFMNGGIGGSIPYFYVFMIILSAVILNKLKYNWLMMIQIIIVIGLILIEVKYPQLVIGYPTEEARIIDVGSSLVVIIFIVFFMITYIMKEYHKTITRLEETHKNLEEANKHLHYSSITDELTGLYNRRFIMELLNEFKETKKLNHSSIIMIDIDHFKQINDEFGHGIGDLVLKTLGDVFKSEIPVDHFTARIGGEEFLTVIPSTSETLGYEFAENLRRLIEKIQWAEKKLSVKISAGVYTIKHNDTIAEALDKADEALYTAKGKGRNRVCKIE